MTDARHILSLSGGKDSAALANYSRGPYLKRSRELETIPDLA
jgi:hypothetical protein